MEHAFNVDHLEKKPLMEASRPPRGGLAHYEQCLSEDEEVRVRRALAEMAKDVRRRNLMVYPYFKVVICWRVVGVSGCQSCHTTGVFAPLVIRIFSVGRNGFSTLSHKKSFFLRSSPRLKDEV